MIYAFTLDDYSLKVKAWHLVAETSEANLMRAIKWQNGSYATYVNEKRKKQRTSISRQI